MSGLLYEAGTPCPPPKPSRSKQTSSGSNVFDSDWDDSLESLEATANLDFTTEIRAPVLTGAKPRRRNRVTSSFQIHEDNEAKPVPPVARRRWENVTEAVPSNRKSSLLSQPAQRFRPRVNVGPSPPKAQRQSTESKCRIGERDSDMEENSALLAQINEEGQRPQGKDVLKKDVRRNTVYIPPDDTTVASAFMGLFSPLKPQNPNDPVGHNREDTQINSLESQIATKGQAKRAYGISPRRSPLQPCQRAPQETSARIDIAGKNSGKENIPPGVGPVNIKEMGSVKDLPVSELPNRPKKIPGKVLGSSKLATTQTGRCSATSGTRLSPARRADGRSEQKKVLGDKQCNAKVPPIGVGQRSSNMEKQKLNSSDIVTISRTSTSTNAAKLSKTNTSLPGGLKLKELNEEYPLLAENISNPAMYEDNWLSHQEIVITQLVNGLFDYTDGKSSCESSEALQYELLKLYQNDFFVQLHKRLQESLSYGGMSVPKFVLERRNCLKQDSVLKRKFIDLWTQTYDIHALRAALETVVGRRVSEPKPFQERVHPPQDGSEACYDMMLGRKVTHFLEVFLLRNEDMDRYGNNLDKDASGCAYRRTVLRSIMIIVLLDKGRLNPGTMLPRQLFSSMSRLKSSAAVLQALGGLMLPSSGDINKPLGHLDCRLSYKQHELQEYEYQISNLAVDLRDGVRLTRIVELLLYPSSLTLNGQQHDQGSPATVSLPDGERLSLSGEDGNYPLSQHLKFPCMKRAVKLFNVRIALGVLYSTKSTRAIVNDVRAEDIVDGHREKTIAVLWGLVSKWGLAELVDWDDVRGEIGRLQRKVMTEIGYDQAMGQSWFHCEDHGDEHSLLLRQWASLLAHLRGMHFENLSTNFADGKIYESIVDEYEGCILGSNERAGESDAGGRRQEGLGLRLERLGCSSQFAHLVSPGASGKCHVLAGDCTLVSLAFLCSRLLSASKRARAATSLQRAWRRVLARRDAHRRTVAREIAKHCAAVVQAKDDIVWAQGVIAKWWRQARGSNGGT
ncbi:Calmodulin-binding protein Sha1 [Aspergillus sp. HF37]|nr:Calmodulin-binding protein Sha1 [Aspergillus sp. HF37]